MGVGGGVMVTVFVKLSMSVEVADASTELDSDVDGVGLTTRVTVWVGDTTRERVRSVSFVMVCDTVAVLGRLDDREGRGFTDAVIDTVIVILLVASTVSDSDIDRTSVIEELTDGVRVGV